ncbi:hypothetical protein PMAYCL1PPCAC_30629 [Pristionchus mayeri]|uniref:G protein-coupled receptor n=1 Tax=Pristionchus mayeri TaxID=1317129 RepID=A0AAN5IDC4_9BILA|nr:hypothetical protein PMAYCL1PPCAC_30629 [Pristionchus mayeri]
MGRDIYFLAVFLAAFLGVDPPDLYEAISFSYLFLSSAAAFSHLDLSLTVPHSTPAALATSVTDMPALVILLRFSASQSMYAEAPLLGALGSFLARVAFFLGEALVVLATGLATFLGDAFFTAFAALAIVQLSE